VARLIVCIVLFATAWLLAPIGRPVAWSQAPGQVAPPAYPSTGYPPPVPAQPPSPRIGRADLSHPPAPNPWAGQPPAAAPGVPFGPAVNVGPAAAQPPQPPGPGEDDLYEAAQIVAVVGNQIILAGDLLWRVDKYLAEYQDKMSPEMIKQQRQRLLPTLLPREIENKLAYVDFLRTIPADKVDEIRQRIYDEYDRSQLPGLLEEEEVRTAAELDQKLRSLGSSLSLRKRQFAEMVMAREAIRGHVNVDNEEVSHEQLLAYYRDHEADFAFAARARWEHLMVRFDEFPDRAAAKLALGEMGNQVLRGAPLEAVAKRSSHAPDANSGGLHDWTEPGALVYQQVDQALFTLPIGQLSRIIESDQGYHIVRVVERHDAGRVSFVEAQVKIKEEILDQRRQKQVEAYLARLRKETPVWTAFELPPPTRRTAGAPPPAAR